MCGLFGIVGSNLSSNDEKVYRGLMINSLGRGVDATGSVSLYYEKPDKKHYRFSLLKNSVIAHSFLREYIPKVDAEHLKRKNTFAYLGHVRAATKGEKVQDNAHPFLFDKLIGFHNGTIIGKFMNSDKFDTDSEALFASLDETDDIQSVMDSVTENYNWSYSLVFFNRKEFTLNFLRSKDRPLVYGYSKNRLYYASESAFIRNMKSIFDLKIETIYSLAEHELTTLDLRLSHNVEKMVNEAIVTKIPPKKRVYQSYSGQGSGHINRNVNHQSHAVNNRNFKPIQDWIERNKSTDIFPKILEEDDTTEYENELKFIVGDKHSQDVVSAHELEDMLNAGCGNCDESIPMEDYLETDWVNKTPICPSCKNLAVVSSYFGDGYEQVPADEKILKGVH